MNHILVLLGVIALSLEINSCQNAIHSSPGTTLKQCEASVAVMRTKIKEHQAAKMDLFTLLNNMVLDPDVQKNDTALGYVCFTYGNLLDEDKQYTRAEEMIIKAKDIAIRLQRPGRSMATLYALLGKIYYKQSKVDSAIMIQKYIIEHFRDTDAPNSSSRESFPVWALQALDVYYPASGKYDEGIVYLKEIHAKYTGTQTAHAALAVLYDLQMLHGKTIEAQRSKELIQAECRTNPQLASLSQTFLDKWKKGEAGNRTRLLQHK